MEELSLRVELKKRSKAHVIQLSRQFYSPGQVEVPTCSRTVCPDDVPSNSITVSLSLRPSALDIDGVIWALTTLIDLIQSHRILSHFKSRQIKIKDILQYNSSCSYLLKVNQNMVSYLSSSVKYLSYSWNGRRPPVVLVRASHWGCTVIMSARIGIAGANRANAPNTTVWSTSACKRYWKIHHLLLYCKSFWEQIVESF